MPGDTPSVSLEAGQQDALLDGIVDGPGHDSMMGGDAPAEANDAVEPWDGAKESGDDAGSEAGDAGGMLDGADADVQSGLDGSTDAVEEGLAEAGGDAPSLDSETGDGEGGALDSSVVEDASDALADSVGGDEPAVVCQAGQRDCVDGYTVGECSSDGFGWEPSPCPGSLPHCIGAGQCVACTQDDQCATPSNECLRERCLVNACMEESRLAGHACGVDGVCNGAGACGVCVPQARDCVGQVPRVCDASGAWVAASACPFVCDGGLCKGECVPSSKQCDGATPQQCDSEGAWQSGVPCSGAKPECFRGECEPPTPPSCTGLSAECGPGADDRCCRWHQAPAGAFYRSYDGVIFLDHGYPASLSGYGLDVYEVTVGRFRAFVDAGKGTRASPPPAGSGASPWIAGSGWNASWNSSLVVDTAALRAALKCSADYETWTDTAGSNETRPINCVTWYEAFAFCAWDGGRLPTESEWNYVAAGGEEQRVRPWSSPPNAVTLTPDHASYWADPATQCMGDGAPGCTRSDLLVVGAKELGKGRWGHFDLAGNVWEWVLDVYQNPYAITPCADCASLGGSSNRVMRGGSFFGNPSTVLASNRGTGAAGTRAYSAGLRCAR